jgi:VCBS repeat-containing protein
MMHFTVEDYSAVDAACQKCCCERLNLKPGTTTKVSVGYAPWAVPIGQLHCAPQFMIEPMETCPLPVSTNMPPQIAPNAIIQTPVGTTVNGTLTLWITDPEAAPVTFKAMPFYSTKHGKLTLTPEGLFTYIPMSGFKGQDSFFVTASDGVNSAVFEILIAVGIDAAYVVPTPTISVGVPTVDSRYFNVSFPITVSPAAKECEMWKLTVLQAALDCACTCFTRTDCFDIGIAKC